MSRLGKHAWKEGYGDAPKPLEPQAAPLALGCRRRLPCAGVHRVGLRPPKALCSLSHLGMFAILSWLARRRLRRMRELASIGQ